MLPLAVYPGRLPRAILQGARRDGIGWTADELDTYLATVSPRATRRLYGQFLTRELGGRHGRLTVRSRLLLGRREPLGHYLATGFPGDVELVDAAGHFLPEEAPALVAERIREAD